MASSYRKIAISEHVADVTTSSASVGRFGELIFFLLVRGEALFLKTKQNNSDKRLLKFPGVNCKAVRFKKVNGWERLFV